MDNSLRSLQCSQFSASISARISSDISSYECERCEREFRICVITFHRNGISFESWIGFTPWDRARTSSRGLLWEKQIGENRSSRFMGCVRVHHSPPSRYRIMYRIVLAYLSSRARYDSVQAFFYRKIGSATFLSKFFRYFLSFSLSLYAWFAMDVENFKRNKFIRNVLINWFTV